MRRRGFLGLCGAAILITGCGSSTRTVTQTVTRTVTAGQHQVTVPTGTDTVTQAVNTTTSTASGLVASNGAAWRCPAGDTVQPLGASVGCYNGSVLDTIQPYVPVGAGGSCPTGTEETYLPNGGKAVCELQPQ